MLRYVSAVAIVLFGFSAPARADVIVVENQEQLIKWFKDGQRAYLEASLSIEPCYQRRHTDCQAKMRVAMVKLTSGVTLAGSTVTQFLEAIRNNSFRYERAYSLLFLNALVEGNPRGGCSEWIRIAQEPLYKGEVRSLQLHLKNATDEVGGREHLPEFEMLTRVKSVLNPCIGAA